MLLLLSKLIVIDVITIPSLQDNRECPFGDKCHFHHDVAEYLASKPADIGDSCYLYDTFGKCTYGLTCRFAKAHTTPDFKTMENAELIKACEGKTTVKNALNKDLQNRLRKRSVAFEKSAEYLKMLSNNKEKKEQQKNGEVTELVVHLCKLYAFVNVSFNILIFGLPRGCLCM